MGKANLFTAAASKEEKKVKKNDRPSVSIINKEFFKKILSFNSLKKEIEEKSTQLETIKQEIIEEGKKHYIDIYQKNKKEPGSIDLVFSNEKEEETVMFLTNKKYPKIDQDIAIELQKKYGSSKIKWDTKDEKEKNIVLNNPANWNPENGIIKKETVYSFDKDMLEKYSEVLSDLIINSKKIADDDKAKIIVANTIYSIEKDTIDRGMEFVDKGISLKDFLEEVKPINSLK